jgi:hypothetical protein
MLYEAQQILRNPFLLFEQRIIPGNGFPTPSGETEKEVIYTHLHLFLIYLS